MKLLSNKEYESLLQFKEITELRLFKLENPPKYKTGDKLWYGWDDPHSGMSYHVKVKIIAFDGAKTPKGWFGIENTYLAFNINECCPVTVEECYLSKKKR